MCSSMSDRPYRKGELFMGTYLSVLEMLEIMEEHGARLVAGESGTDREVFYFDMIEHPDIKPWARKGILFITTGYAVRNDKEALLNLINGLNQSEAAALAMKTRFFDPFPQEVLDLAEEIGFPLIFLDNSAGFVDITYPIMEALVNAKNKMEIPLRYQMDGQERKLLNTQLFLDLLIPEYEDWKKIEYRIAALRWPMPPVRMVSIQIVPYEAGKVAEGGVQERLYKLVSDYLGAEEFRCTVISKNCECICLLSEQGKNEPFFNLLTILKKRIEAVTGAKVYMGISMKMENYRDISDTYADVQDAVTIGKVPRINRDVTEIETVRFEQALMRMSEHPFFRTYISDKLSKLQQYDVDNGGRLVETLDVLIRNAGVRKAAAAELYLHRNTLAYRIKKIEQLTGEDLSKGEILMQLGLALNMRDYL